MDFTKGRRHNDANSPLSEKKDIIADAKPLSSNKVLLSEAKNLIDPSLDASQSEGMVALGDQAQISVEPHQPKYER